MESRSAIDDLSDLAQRTRLDVFRLFVRREFEGFPAGEVAWSRGSQSKGEVHPYARRLLEKLNHPGKSQRSTSWDEFAAPGTLHLGLRQSVIGIPRLLGPAEQSPRHRTDLSAHA